MLPLGIIFERSKYHKKILKKDILGKPLLYLPYLTSVMKYPYRNWPFSAWILLNGSMLPHGIIFEWSKCH
jgi:hypothetical protein